MSETGLGKILLVLLQMMEKVTPTMKRILALIALLAFTVCVATGCNKSGTETPAGGEATNAPASTNQ